ncbi:Dehydration-responsive element-binding protein 1G [Dendrobium catenatum]|uniref:Dehydration-responsive element-binding protein 1G n=1 Tax=Dendrobium catenatum TaxID=906689 RepID=A0A2I0W959_9ASPA|nr:Dehydration-responsive element-binding protein 1G [Dendrobium catenatum]
MNLFRIENQLQCRAEFRRHSEVEQNSGVVRHSGRILASCRIPVSLGKNCGVTLASGQISTSQERRAELWRWLRRSYSLISFPSILLFFLLGSHLMRNEESIYRFPGKFEGHNDVGIRRSWARWIRLVELLDSIISLLKIPKPEAEPSAAVAAVGMEDPFCMDIGMQDYYLDMAEGMLINPPPLPSEEEGDGSDGEVSLWNYTV